ncbi:MAG: DUF4168 domain-containing protein [Alphaproteobacteria bacterium]
MPSRLTITAGAALLALGVAGLPAAAQDQPSPAIEAEDITDEQLDQFAEAALAVNEIGREYGPELQSAEDEAEAEEIRAEAQEEMMQAVENEGLSLEEYNAIYAAAENDQEINSAIQTLLQEKQENAAGG